MKGIRIVRPLPMAGSKFVREWKSTIYELYVSEVGGVLQYKVDGKLFNSPTGAAKYVTKQEVNGWKFWKI